MGKSMGGRCHKQGHLTEDLRMRWRIPTQTGDKNEQWRLWNQCSTHTRSSLRHFDKQHSSCCSCAGWEPCMEHGGGVSQPAKWGCLTWRPWFSWTRHSVYKRGMDDFPSKNCFYWPAVYFRNEACVKNINILSNRKKPSGLICILFFLVYRKPTSLLFHYSS